MAKAVLVMDMPEECNDHCPLYHRVPGDVYCAKGTKPLPLSGKPDWCPLVELPDRIDEPNKLKYAEPKSYIAGIHDGYNWCLGELEGKQYG